MAATDVSMTSNAGCLCAAIRRPELGLTYARVAGLPVVIERCDLLPLVRDPSSGFTKPFLRRAWTRGRRQGRGSVPSTLMTRHGFVIGLRPEAEAEYRELHAKTWPAVKEQIKRSNIRNYSIFLHGNLLFGYFEYGGSDFEADMRAMAADPETQRWWELTESMQQPLPSRHEGEWWAEMEEVFHLD
jgi:L-rhamnose mutarotase